MRCILEECSHSRNSHRESGILQISSSKIQGLFKVKDLDLRVHLSVKRLKNIFFVPKIEKKNSKFPKKCKIKKGLGSARFFRLPQPYNYLFWPNIAPYPTVFGRTALLCHLTYLTFYRIFWDGKMGTLLKKLKFHAFSRAFVFIQFFFRPSINVILFRPFQNFQVKIQQEH